MSSDETSPMFRTSISFESFYNQLQYSSPRLIKSIKPPYLPAYCGHIREVAFGERDN